MIKITIPMSLLDTDQQVQQLAVGAVIKGAKPTFEGDDTIYEITPKHMPLDYAKLLLSKGAAVENMPLFIEVDPAANVPSGMYGATSIDEDENVTQNTWNDWLSPNHSVLVRDGRSFVGTNGHDGIDHPLSDLVAVLDDLVAPSDLPTADEPELP